MNFFESISKETKARNLRFLVIGGLAINLYGYSRETADLDLLIRREDREQNSRIDRFLKDFLDVEHLIRINKLDIKSKNIKQLFAKYGTMELYEKVSTALAGK